MVGGLHWAKTYCPKTYGWRDTVRELGKATAAYPSFGIAPWLVNGTPKPMPPLAFLTNAEIPDALIQKGLRLDLLCQLSEDVKYQMP